MIISRGNQPSAMANGHSARSAQLPMQLSTAKGNVIGPFSAALAQAGIKTLPSLSTPISNAISFLV